MTKLRLALAHWYLSGTGKALARASYGLPQPAKLDVLRIAERALGLAGELESIYARQRR